MYQYKDGCKSCGIGLVRIYVRTDGEIYGCAANLNESGYLGDVQCGFSKKKIQECRKNFFTNDVCAKCSINEHCLTKLCIMNYEQNEEGEKST